jgi:PfaD family protein
MITSTWLDPRSVEALWTLDRPVHAVAGPDGIVLVETPHGRRVLASAPAITVDRFGAASFRDAHGVRAAYVAGAMAGGIGSTRLVTAMGQAGLLGGFGAGGLGLDVVDRSIRAIQQALGARENYKANLLHAPLRPELEDELADLYLARGVRRISASGYMTLTPAVVVYRTRGLVETPDGRVDARNHVFAKVSRTEVAEQFMRPAPSALLARLVAAGRITEGEARLAERVPVAEDVTAEGDSGGHTDRRPALPLLSAIMALRDRIAVEERYDRPIRVGCAGGIGTPSMVLAAFVAGADYIVTGSINQSCVEAATSDLVKSMLASIDVAGVEMAPAADMFELGVKVQVLKRGSLFASRADRLHRLYASYDSLDAIPPEEIARLETQIFRRPLGEVWTETVEYLERNAPRALDEARTSPKKKMALTFRWYLGMASRWAVAGDAGRKVDFQVWCGPAMGAFNEWARSTALERPQNRRVAEVAARLLDGAAALFRARILALQGVEVPAGALRQVPGVVEERV